MDRPLPKKVEVMVMAETSVGVRESLACAARVSHSTLRTSCYALALDICLYTYMYALTQACFRQRLDQSEVEV